MSEFLAFIVVGAVGTTCHYLVLIALVELTNTDPIFAAGAGAAVGAIVNYVLNYKFTFRSRKSHYDAFSRFLCVAVIGMALNTLIVGWGVHILKVHYIICQIVATGIVLVLTFAGNKLWSFRENRDERRGYTNRRFRG